VSNFPESLLIIGVLSKFPFFTRVSTHVYQVPR